MRGVEAEWIALINSTGGGDVLVNDNANGFWTEELSLLQVEIMDSVINFLACEWWA